ncbi:hypothetical protein R1sor_010676 [Riccia sorocarpa]|uniref:Uncharacterized protein n=1 Tax=Riccia sorocarpa TaxID=122646 RepID=A0ABD3HYQ7_9MARC
MLGWALSEDPVIAWELAWGRLREKFKDFRRRERERMSYLQIQQKRLSELRESLASGVTEENRELLGTLENEVKEKELMEASIIRRRSRIQWVSEGEDNTRYFYSCLQAKQTQERLVELQGEGGEIITEEEDLLASVHSFYQDLYRQPNISPATREERRETFKLAQKFVEGEDNRRLEAAPDGEEIQRIVDALPSNKAPGEDGLTVEVLKQVWEWVQTPCIEFLTTVLPALFHLIWTERNDAVFNQRDRQTPLDVALVTARIEAEVNLRKPAGLIRQEQGMRCLNENNSIISGEFTTKETEGPAGGGNFRTSVPPLPDRTKSPIFSFDGGRDTLGDPRQQRNVGKDTIETSGRIVPRRRKRTLP